MVVSFQGECASAAEDGWRQPTVRVWKKYRERSSCRRGTESVAYHEAIPALPETVAWIKMQSCETIKTYYRILTAMIRGWERGFFRNSNNVYYE